MLRLSARRGAQCDFPLSLSQYRDLGAAAGFAAAECAVTGRNDLAIVIVFRV